MLLRHFVFFIWVRDPTWSRGEGTRVEPSWIIGQNPRKVRGVHALRGMYPQSASLILLT